MSIPDVSKLQKMAVQSYEDRGNDVEDWQLIDSTPTLKFYSRNRDLVIAIRGTADMRDTKADAMIAIGQLERSDRFKEDLAKVQDVLNRLNPENVFGVGHSLGGAIMDLFLHKGIIEKGVSYNPAVQPQDIPRTLPNRRIYMSSDPLYLLIGRLLVQKPEVRPSKTSIFTTLLQLSPAGNLLTANSYLKNHKLEQFEGGVRMTAIMRKILPFAQLRKNNQLSEEEYDDLLIDLQDSLGVSDKVFGKELRAVEIFVHQRQPRLRAVVEETESEAEGGRCPKCGLINSDIFKKKHNIPVNRSLSLKQIAKLSGMPIKALNEVYDKGMGAYYTNPGSVKPMVQSPEQWAMGRVYSFVMKRKTTFGKADKSIAEKYKLL